MNWKGIVILMVIVFSLIPFYLFNKYLQQKIRPRESFARLFGYLLFGFMAVFIFTFLVVFIIKKVYPGA